VEGSASGSLPRRVSGVSAGPWRRGWNGLSLLLRYGLAGLVTQILYLSVLGAGLALNWHYLLAMGVGQVCAITFAFPTYRARVFRATGPVLPQLVKFLGVWWVGVAASFIGVPLLVEGFRVQPFPAQLVIAIAVVGISFLSHRGVTFRARETAPAEASPPTRPLTVPGVGA
jgi:putative flippase GtrA